MTRAFGALAPKRIAETKSQLPNNEKGKGGRMSNQRKAKYPKLQWTRTHQHLQLDTQVPLFDSPAIIGNKRKTAESPRAINRKNKIDVKKTLQTNLTRIKKFREFPETPKTAFKLDENGSYSLGPLEWYAHLDFFKSYSKKGPINSNPVKTKLNNK